jgi:hypothetical protein
MRYVRAFFGALWLTLQGKIYTPPTPPSKYPKLDEWLRVAEQRLITVFRIADKQGITEDKRKTIKLVLDRRDITMETILQSVQHNLAREYPLLIKTEYDHTLTTLYALNLNDQYRVSQLQNASEIANTPLQNAVFALAEHLKNIPPSTNLSD